MSKPLFSTASIGRNESKTLPRLLGSLKEFMARGGEVIYVDTGSTDNTAQIARDAGCRVFEEGPRFHYTCDEETAKAINEKFVVPGDPPIINAGDRFFAFDKARNYAMTLAKNDFICTPDCDEAWTVLDIDKLNKFIEEGYQKLMVDFVFAHFPDGKPAVEFCADTRLYDRREVKWKGIIHETMRHGDIKMGRVSRNVAFLEHFQNKETDRSKYLAGLAWACYDEPENDRNSHYFARELMYRGYTRSAIKEFRRHIDMNQWADERGQSMVYMGNCYEALGEDEMALDSWHKAFELTGNRREPLIALAYYWKKKDKRHMVAAYAAAALQIPNNGFYANRVSNYTFEPHALLYWANGWTGNLRGARENWLKCYDYHPDMVDFKRDFQYYFSQPKVSIVIPSIRVDKLERCLEVIKANAGYDNYEVIVKKDDPDNPKGAPKLVKEGVEEAAGELVMFLGDDTIPQHNFLYHAIVAMNRHYPDLDGLIGLNDGLWKRGELATHWLASRKLLPYLGGEFFHTGYVHCGCDSELTEMCKKVGKYAWAENAKIVHDHPSAHGWSDETYDKHYRRVYDPEIMRKDRDLLFKRSKELGFKVSFGTGALGDYPDVPEAIDLRKRIFPKGMKVLNVGVGPGDSWLAKQLPHLEFKRLDHIDVHEPYIFKAREIPWAAEEVRFRVGDITNGTDFSDYDMVFFFDVIEHLEKDDALRILNTPVKKLLFVPLETTPRENQHGVESQEHRSFWTEEELNGLGLKTQRIRDFMRRRDGTMMDSVWAWTP